MPSSFPGPLHPATAAVPAAVNDDSASLCALVLRSLVRHAGANRVEWHWPGSPGDAPAEKLREILEQSRARSAAFDVITNQVPVTIDVTTD